MSDTSSSRPSETSSKTPSPQDASADQPVTEVKQEIPPTPQGRADDDTDVRDDDGDTDIE